MKTTRIYTLLAALLLMGGWRMQAQEFNTKAYQPSGELIITPDTLWLTETSPAASFIIRNETLQDVVINNIEPNNWLLGVDPNPYEFYPYILNADSILVVEVSYIGPPPVPFTKDYFSANVIITTSIGERNVVVMYSKTFLDQGLIGMHHVELTANQSQAELYVLNGNFGTLTPIEIFSITETENETGIPYLIIEPQHELPYTLEAEEQFVFVLSPNTQIGGKGVVETFVIIESSVGDFVVSVLIDEYLLTVTELNAQVEIYPNPAREKVTIDGIEPSVVQVYNALGQVVKTACDTNEIDLSGMVEGVYLLRITDAKGVSQTERITVIK